MFVLFNLVDNLLGLYDVFVYGQLTKNIKYQWLGINSGDIYNTSCLLYYQLR